MAAFVARGGTDTAKAKFGPHDGTAGAASGAFVSGAASLLPVGAARLLGNQGSALLPLGAARLLANAAALDVAKAVNVALGHRCQCNAFGAHGGAGELAFGAHGGVGRLCAVCLRLYLGPRGRSDRRLSAYHTLGTRLRLGRSMANCGGGGERTKWERLVQVARNGLIRGMERLMRRWVVLIARNGMVSGRDWVMRM